MADSLSATLERIDPTEAWAPYRPSGAVPWNRKWIAHLYRRAAFGPTPAETDRGLKDGPETTLNRLLSGEPDAADRLEVLLDTGRYMKNDTQLRVWWLSAMLDGGHPLREKLTLFWHNHFATSYAKVQRTQLMFEQNVLLRKHALGKFRPFLLDMSRDTAMLKWLDSNQNIKGAPNENYAREVMELFSLGVGHYTEKDIQEAARAFTGWHVDSRPNEDEDTFQFKPVVHDDGEKSVFGQKGNWNGDDIVRFCCDRPDCATFLVGKLYSFLISETRPPESLVAPLADRFRKSDYDIADLVKTILGSRLMFSEHAYRKRVKWPVEYVLGAVRAAVPNRAPLGDLVEPLAKMGQVLFAPPNVKGWRTGTDWLNSATLLARNNFAETVAMGTWPRVSTRAPTVTAAGSALVPPETVADPAVPAGVVETPESLAATAAIAGAPAAYSPVREMTNADGTRTTTPVIVVQPASGASPPLPAGPPGATPVPKAPSPDASAPPPAAGFDPVESLLAPKPKDAAAVVDRMAERLYGEELPKSARSRLVSFLTAGKPALTEKDLENPAFRAKVREALHAVMCLPEYQLN
jgi:hypothetical protein